MGRERTGVNYNIKIRGYNPLVVYSSQQEEGSLYLITINVNKWTVSSGIVRVFVPTSLSRITSLLSFIKDNVCFIKRLIEQ